MDYSVNSILYILLTITISDNLKVVNSKNDRIIENKKGKEDVRKQDDQIRRNKLN